MANYQINFKKINSDAISVCQTLQSNGFQSFIVGGCVRDLLLDTNPKDWDICTDATPQEVMKLFPKHYPTGLAHGTITVVGEKQENQFEVTTFRTEGKYLDGRRPENVDFVKDINQDLARRDLTINAMAVDPISNQLIDPFNGILDLQNKIIKAVGAADDRFREDGLRIMRVARFAARFGYEIEELTFKAMKNNLDTLKLVSKERIKDELCKILMTKHAFYGLNILKDTEILNIICPSLVKHINKDFPPDINSCSGALETKVALMYYYVYDWNIVEQELISLKFSNKEIKRIIFQLKLLHMVYNEFDKSYYVHFMAYLKNSSPGDWQETLNEFVALTNALNIDFQAVLDKYKDITVLSRKELQINGNDLIMLGFSGPQIKSVLDNCYRMVLQYPENNNKEFLLGFLE